MKAAIGPLVLMVSASLAAAAEPPSRDNWVQAKLAAVIPDDCHCLKDSAGLGLGLGTWLNPTWGLELDAVQIQLQSREGGIQAHETEVQGAFLFDPFNLGLRWKPYLRAGLGLAQVQTPFSLVPDATTRFTFHWGGGVQHRYGQHGISSLEVRSTNVETLRYRRETAAILGLGLRWGGTGPAAAPAPPIPALAAQPPAPAAPMPPPPAQAQAPSVAAPAPALQPEPLPAPLPVTRVVLDETRLHFGNDRSELPASALAPIRQVIQALLAYQGPYTLAVTGHSSSDGGAGHNRALSLRRARAVAAVLVAGGIPAGRVRVAGLGPDQPIADNRTPEGKARNRRVEIEVRAAGAEVRHLPS